MDYREETFMNDVEAAKFLRLSPQTLRNWRTKCRGPAYSKLGRAVRYNLAGLRAFTEQNRVSSAD